MYASSDAIGIVALSQMSGSTASGFCERRAALLGFDGGATVLFT